MIQKFNRIIDFFIHSALKQEKTLFEKAKIAVLAFFIVLGMSLLYETFYFLKGYNMFDIKSLHNYLGFSVAIIGLAVIKKTGKINLALSIGALMGAYLVSASSYLGGGINSNDILWYTVLTSASFMFIGKKTGFIVLIFSIVATTCFYFFEMFHLIKFDSNLVSLSLEYKYFNFLLILSVLTLMVYILVSGNKKLQEAVQVTREEEVRKQIARDFQDQIGNKMSSIRHLSELVHLKKTNEEKLEVIFKIDENAKQAYDNFKDFIWSLDPKSDQLSELFMYLRDFADDSFKYSDTNLHINFIPEEIPKLLLSSYYSKEIISLFKEALTNVFRNSDAKNIYIDFIIEEAKLCIKLKDDGMRVQNDSDVVSSIKTRAEKIGGQLLLETNINKGTEIVFILLLPQKGSYKQVVSC